jgi:succinate-semialdehyde dehydrogenase / glutarate-semialdehyde dehydrogenase
MTTPSAQPVTIRSLETAHSGFQRPTEAYIDGRWHAGHGTRFDDLNPADGSCIARVVDCEAELAALAADAAARALPAWREATARQRSDLLRAWLELIRARTEPLAALVSAEHGKPLAESRWEVAYAIGNIEWMAEEAKRAYGEVIPAPVPGRRLLAVKEPVGVVALVTPWNFPLALLARKIAPALAAGCTVVAKPSEDAPLAALALAALAHEAGIPPGVINIVPCSRENAPQVVDTWLADARVRKLSFTGSVATGKRLAKGAADTLKRVSLELGGNAPFIVFEDADLDRAVAGAIWSKFRSAGQTCLCANRIYVQSSVYESFSERFVAASSRLTVGAAADGVFDQGPLINERAAAKVAALIDDAVAKGAKVAAGGQRLTGAAHARGQFFAPTVLTGVQPHMRIAAEETFGPVAPIFRFDDERQVIDEANATQAGLAGYFYTRDLARAWRVAAALEVGMVGINDAAIAGEMVPFGGIKESGYGIEGSSHGLAEYMSIKYVCMGGLT